MPKSVEGILKDWQARREVPRTPAVSPALPQTPKREGVPGLMATRNHLKSIRQSTLPKGMK